MKIRRRDFLIASASACLLAKDALTAPAQRRPSRTTSKPFSVEGRKVTVYTTAEKTGHRISPTDAPTFKRHGQPLETQVCVFVDPTRTYQTFLGIGGALTDSSAEVFAKLPADKQREFLEAYFDARKGIGYTFARTNIHSCDFSSGSYTYVAEGDKELKTFSVAHDRQFRIPFIKRASAAAGGRLTLFASPRSPPAFMKDNHDMPPGGKRGREFYRAWADCFSKFVKSYEPEGAPVWGSSTKNEPMATPKWESCIYT